MATTNYNFILFTRPIWRQNETATWDGIDDAYVKSFIDSGCFLCAITMLTACMEGNRTLKPATVAARGVTTNMTTPFVERWDLASDEFVLREKESNFIYYIAKTLIEDRKPVIIQVPGNPGHAVVAYGFNGAVDVINGEPAYSLVNKNSIKIYDPYMGRFDDNLPGLIDHYGDITKVRIPE